MIRRILRSGWLWAVPGGLVLGVGSALFVLGNGQLLGRESYDGWFGNRNAGSTAADPYTRGIIAKIGLLALNRSETIYFHKYLDEQGRRLRSDCSYELSGGDLPTRWWSITIYAADDFLPVNGDNAESVDATQLVRDTSGRWTARIAPDRDGASNWVSTRNAPTFSLGLRMYNPNASARDNPATIAFPKLKTLKCGDKA